MENNNASGGERGYIKEAEFRSGSKIIMKRSAGRLANQATNINGMYDNAKERVIEEMHNYISMGSGWRLVRVV